MAYFYTPKWHTVVYWRYFSSILAKFFIFSFLFSFIRASLCHTIFVYSFFNTIAFSIFFFLTLFNCRLPVCLFFTKCIVINKSTYRYYILVPLLYMRCCVLLSTYFFYYSYVIRWARAHIPKKSIHHWLCAILYRSLSLDIV